MTGFDRDLLGGFTVLFVRYSCEGGYLFTRCESRDKRQVGHYDVNESHAAADSTGSARSTCRAMERGAEDGIWRRTVLICGHGCKVL